MIFIYFPALGAGGRRFESFCPDNENQGVTKVIPFFIYAICTPFENDSFIMKRIILPILLLFSASIAFAQDGKGELVSAYIIDNQKYIGINEDSLCPLFSVVKFPQALYVAHCLNESDRSLDDKVVVRKHKLMHNTWSPMLRFFKVRHKFSYAELLRYSLQESDNNACDLLFDAFGSPNAVEKYMKELGFEDIRIAKNERQMMAEKASASQNAASPKAIAHLLQWFYEHHNDNNYLAFVWQLMSECKTGTSRLPSILHDGDSIIHKTGTGFSTEKGVSAINDAGIIMHPDGSHCIAVVFVLNHPDGVDSAERLLAETAARLLQKLQ